MATTESSATGQSQTLNRPVPGYVDWIAAVLIALGGLAAAAGGSALLAFVDRESLAAGVESGQLTVSTFEQELTQAETLAVAADVVNWTGLGLLVIGVGLFLFAIGFGIARYRARSRSDAARSVRTYAVLGAVATTLLSFLPLSPAVGGGLASYFGNAQTERPIAIGALSGLLSVLPVLVLLAFVAAGLFTGLSSVQPDMGLVTVALMGLSALFVLVYSTGLGAAGGFLGGRIAERGE